MAKVHLQQYHNEHFNVSAISRVLYHNHKVDILLTFTVHALVPLFISSHHARPRLISGLRNQGYLMQHCQLPWHVDGVPEKLIRNR